MNPPSAFLRPALLQIAVFAVGLVCFTNVADANTIRVTTTQDTPINVLDPSCSLREAVYAAQNNLWTNGCPAGSGTDEVVLPAGTYTLLRDGDGDQTGETGDIDITGNDNLTIRPEIPGSRVILDGAGLENYFEYLGHAELNLKDLTVTGGDSALPGGGIRAATTSSGKLNLSGLTVNANKSTSSGGGIGIQSKNLVVEISNSTISGNSAELSGGGIFLNGGGSIRNTTITANTADLDKDSSGDGGGLFAWAKPETVSMTNSINAGNTDLSPDQAKRSPDCATGPSFFPRFVVSSQILGQGSCLIGADPGTNKFVADPMLGPLTDNGGPNFTHALLVGSPAIDAGGQVTPDDCPTVDQRGIARSGACDIGAYEFVPKPVVVANPKPDPDRCLKNPSDPGCHVQNPTVTTVTFDGKNLQVRLKCPGRFKPKCLSRAVPVTAKGFKRVKRGGRMVRVPKGKAMAAVKKVTVRSNRWLTVTFLVKPAFRAQVAALSKLDGKRLVVRQRIRSKRLFKRKNRKLSTIFQVYKVREQA